jgi:hypothetical protein
MRPSFLAVSLSLVGAGFNGKLPSGAIIYIEVIIY